MAVKIRFSRIGKKHAPVYRIVAVDSRKKRDGKYLENLGTYNPLTKEIVQFHTDRIAYWVSVGAVINDSVKRLMKIKGVSVSLQVVDSKKADATEEKKADAKAVKKAAAPKKTAAKKTTKAAPKKVVASKEKEAK